MRAILEDPLMNNYLALLQCILHEEVSVTDSLRHFDLLEKKEYTTRRKGRNGGRRKKVNEENKNN